jgi:hypothetical protein
MTDLVLGFELEQVVTDTRLYPLGARAQDANGNMFILVQYSQGDGAEAGTQGHLVCLLDTAFGPFEVTADMDSAVIPALRNRPMGQLQATLADGERGWAQYKGYNRQAMVSDGSVAQGERLMLHATTAGGCDTAAGGAAEIGTALENDGAAALSAGQVYIDIPL